MLESPYTDNKSCFEALVVSVDTHRSVCIAKSIRGAILTDVRWITPVGSSNRETSAFSPRAGELVYVDTSTGNPIIVGSMGRMPEEGNTQSQIISDTPSEDTGNSSIWDSDQQLKEGVPVDFIEGDKLIKSEADSMIGVLRAGTIIAKANEVCQFILSPVNRLGRIIVRNWELFTDTHQDITKNFHGRGYRYVAYSDTAENVRKDVYKHYTVTGDVSAGDHLKGAYWGQNPSNVPSATNVINYRVTQDQNKNKLLEYQYKLDGSTYKIVRSSDKSKKSEITHDNNQMVFKTTDGNVGFITITGSEVYLNWNGETIMINSAGIKLFAQGHSVTINSSGVALA